jgi:hypothetical protein
MGMYDGWLDFWVIKPLEKISSSENRIKFLFEMQRKFNRENTGKEADPVKKELQMLIEQEMLLNDFNRTNQIKKVFERKPSPTKDENKLSLNEIALKYVFEGNQITREDSTSIAKEYGHNSGDKLYQRCSYWGSRANRTGRPEPCTPKKLKNKIELFEKVIKLLPEPQQKRAVEEVEILKRIYDEEYL